MYYVRDGPNLVAACENFGLEVASEWPRDLLADAYARIQIGATASEYRARLATDAEIARSMPRLVEMWPALATAAGEVCSFPVFFEILSAKGIFKFFSDGRLLITGQLKVRLTNLDSPEKALALNVSGPGHIDASGTEIGLGSGIFILFAGFDVGGPTLLFTHGRFVSTRAPDGSIASIEVHGTSTDLCAAPA